MGYTHYFEYKENVLQIPERLVEDVKVIIEKHINILDENYTIDSGVLVLNGNPGHETLYIEPNVDGFCKTNYALYDVAVCEILLAFKHHFKESFELESDGFFVQDDLFAQKEDLMTDKLLDGNWNDALKNVKKQFGYEFDLIPTIDSGYCLYQIKVK